MLFKDLLNIKFNRNDNRVDEDTLKKLLPKTPKDIIEQFYSDHGRNEVFQSQYEKIDLLKVSWSKLSVRADTLSECSYYEGYNSVEVCAEWAKAIVKDGWDYLDFYPDEVVDSWRNSKTWFRIPVFINGRLINRNNRYHLVEGHSRLGLLKGLLENGIIQNESTHDIWYGS